MVSKTSCKRCGRLGNFNEVKLYPLPHNPSRSMFLCEACYRKMIFEMNREKVQTKPCHQCGRIIPVDARLCPYCGLPLRSESLRGSRRFETMCGFCGARFVGSPTVCPSCGKRIMQIPEENKSTWLEGNRVTKNMVLVVVLIVGVVIGAIFIHMYLTSLSVKTEAGVVGAVDFSVSDCQVIDHNGRTAIQIFFSSNAGGEIRITDSFNRVLGYTAFSSTDKSKIIDIGNVGETINISSYSVLAICQQQIVFSKSFSVIPTVVKISVLNIDWLYKQDRLEYALQSITIPLTTIIGDFPVYITSIDIIIDFTDGPYSNPISDSDQYIILTPGESTELIIPINISRAFNQGRHDITVYLKDSYNDVLCEFTQNCFISI